MEKRDKEALTAIRKALKSKDTDENKMNRITSAVLRARGAGGGSPFDGPDRCPWCGDIG